jgi:hypothetical protein
MREKRMKVRLDKIGSDFKGRFGQHKDEWMKRLIFSEVETGKVYTMNLPLEDEKVRQLWMAEAKEGNIYQGVETYGPKFPDTINYEHGFTSCEVAEEETNEDK